MSGPISDADIRAAGFRLYDKKIKNDEEYAQWVEEYKGYYPHAPQKPFEHYASLKAVGWPTKSNVVVDLAADQSPLVTKLKEDDAILKGYRQDLSFEPGVNGEVIGSPASDIPLSDDSVDIITVMCAYEHFQGDEDIAFLSEAKRILKPGGKVIIAPFYTWTEYLLTPPQPSPNTGFGRFYDKEQLRERIKKNLDGLTAFFLNVHLEDEFKFRALILRK